MLETPHVAVGAALAVKLGNPLLAIPLSVASHFVLDKVPHWNPHTYTETVTNGGPSKSTIIVTAVDIAISIALGFGVAYSVLPNKALALSVLASCLASVLPDVSKYPFFVFKKTRKGLYKKWVETERSFQIQTNSLFWGLLTQVLIIAASIWWIYN